jgi:hypothetical protein
MALENPVSVARFGYLSNSETQVHGTFSESGVKEPETDIRK